MRLQLADTFRSLKVRNFRLFLTGQLIALIGTWMRFIALDWLALDLSGNSGTALGLVTAFQLTPTLLFALYAGKLADRFDKRRLLQICNAIWLVLTLVLAGLVMTDAIRLWQIYVFSVLLGVVTALENPTRQAFAAELVGTELLPNAMALNGATFNSARIVGPALAGVLIAVVDIGPIFVINAGTLLVTVVTLGLMRSGELHRAPRATKNATVRDGLAYVRKRPDLLLPLGLVAVIGGFGFNFQVTLALLAKEEFHTGAAAFGLLTTALAVGALAGALGGTKRRRRPSVYVVTGAAIGFGTLEILAGFAPGFVAATVLLVPTGFLMVFFAQAANQRVQLGVSPEMRGRVMALYVMVFLGSTPVIAPAVGWLGGTFGPRSGLWVGGALSLAAGVFALTYRTRRRGVRVALERRPVPHLVFSESGVPAVRSFPATLRRYRPLDPATTVMAANGRGAGTTCAVERVEPEAPGSAADAVAEILAAPAGERAEAAASAAPAPAATGGRTGHEDAAGVDAAAGPATPENDERPATTAPAPAGATPVAGTPPARESGGRPPQRNKLRGAPGRKLRPMGGRAGRR